MNLVKWLVTITLFAIIMLGSVSINKIYTSFILAIITLFITSKLQKLNSLKTLQFNWKIINYCCWLFQEVILSALSVIRLCLHKKIDINPVVSEIKTQHQNDLPQTIFANSITLTPGTITLDIDNNIIVHSITEKHALALEKSEMDKKIRGSYK
jgi:multicomponent Na+:H+ antiporter subunit E